MNLEPIADKWKVFGWNVIEINGHDFNQILDAFEKAKKCSEKPTMIIAHTIKGRGGSFMKNVVSWHESKVPNAEELEKALSELNAERKERRN